MPTRRTVALTLAFTFACTPSPEPPVTSSPTTTLGPASDSSSSITAATDQGTTTAPTTTTADSTASDDGPIFDVGGGSDAPNPEPLPEPQLWYSVEDLLVYIELDPADGTVAELVVSTITNEPPLLSDAPGVVEFGSITMLDDGSLLGARGLEGQTQLYHVAEPPTVATDLEVDLLGDVPGQLFIEALYTDCDGRVYLMDTGVHSSSPDGNRLLRFTGDFLAGDFTYEVITDLMVAVAADIDDMAPGIDAMGAIADNPGFAIDSGTVFDFDYTTGTGAAIGIAGTYGIHALGGVLFDDGVSRLYVLTLDAELLEVDPVTLATSEVLTVGPMPAGPPYPGMSGMAGPLTDCVSGFPRG